MQLAMIDHGGWIVFVDQMSWSTYGRNSLEKLFDIGKESKYHALFEDALFAVPTICCYIIKEWGQNSNFQPTHASRQSSANPERPPS